MNRNEFEGKLDRLFKIYGRDHYHAPDVLKVDTKSLWSEVQRLLDVDAAFAEPETCVWEYSAKYGHWNTECRCSKTFTGGGNPYTFCPFCHGKIVEIGGPEAESDASDAGSVPHVVSDGSRSHVTHWDGDGAHCSEPNCEMNEKLDAPEPQPKYDGQINCQKCGTRHPIGLGCGFTPGIGGYQPEGTGCGDPPQPPKGGTAQNRSSRADEQSGEFGTIQGVLEFLRLRVEGLEHRVSRLESEPAVGEELRDIRKRLRILEGC